MAFVTDTDTKYYGREVNKEMKCPLITIRHAGFNDCLKGKCAWWYEHPLTKIKDSGIKGECAILKIAKNTGNIGSR